MFVPTSTRRLGSPDEPHKEELSSVRSESLPLDGPTVARGHHRSYDALLERVDDAEIVLLGEASHGTHEFYEQRALITRRLIEEKGFGAVAVEADWPDAHRLDRFVHGAAQDTYARTAFSAFHRFPVWMWRNRETLAFIEWLRSHNDAVADPSRKVGFHGLDLYSLYQSMSETVRFLEKIDPRAARDARERYACFDHFNEDSQTYGAHVSSGMHPSCAQEVVAQLVALQKGRSDALDVSSGRTQLERTDMYFQAEQNARLVKNAEQYYRAMFEGRVSSWNLRDTHMMETLLALKGHLAATGRRDRIVVWAHNSHLGDARATNMSRIGEINLGQLVRERFPRTSFSVGFTTYTGTVAAASFWDGPVEFKRVVPGLPGSYESFLHAVGGKAFLLDFRAANDARDLLSHPRLERAIGVIYLPESERRSHYFQAQLSRQFDAVIHIDESHALEPLPEGLLVKDDDAPETFPFAV